MILWYKCGKLYKNNFMIIYFVTLNSYPVMMIVTDSNNISRRYSMTHEETSLKTKQAICNSLKEIMRQKPFSKITVSEIITHCNINRKTFYYHFEDIYGLLKWMLEQEAFEVVRQFDMLTDYQDVFTFVVDYVSDNSYFLNCIYDSVGRDELKRFFYKDFIGIVEKMIDDYSKELNVTISDDFRQFLCNFYTEAVAGMLIDLFQNPEKCDHAKMYQYFSVILTSSLPAVLKTQA